MTTKSKVWINGKLFDAGGAKIPVSDRGFLYGDGAFETMRSYAGIVFMLREHMARLSRSLKTIRIRPQYPPGYIEAAVSGLLRANRISSAYIRLMVTRGEGYFGMAQRDRFRPNIVIFAKQFEGYPERMYLRGIKVRIVRTRQNEFSAVSGVKATSFLNHIVARYEAREGGADEAILLNTKGQVCEAATSNVFIVKKEKLITPSIESGILPGIARGVVISIALRLGIRVEERSVCPEELSGCDEIFLTNSMAEVLPVTSVGPKRVGKGLPGEMTKLFRASYQKEVIRYVSKNSPSPKF